jgi:hypothetical protein
MYDVHYVWNNLQNVWEKKSVSNGRERDPFSREKRKEDVRHSLVAFIEIEFARSRL